ncbi:MAG: type II toxin-antitoxin system RelE/ParE family toxin [Nitrospirae bacterium]|nr:type II toxin-antitoxin system RelE/ParE family toxin [Nitrospirota bacterium]
MDQLPVEEQGRIYAAIDFLGEKGNTLREPFSKSLGGGLLELRIRTKGDAYRVFYCFLPGQVVYLLHAFKKKTRKTPKSEMDIAQKRQREIKGRER